MADTTTADPAATTEGAPPASGADTTPSPAPGQSKETKPSSDAGTKNNQADDFESDDWIDSSNLSDSQKAHIRKTRSQAAKRKEELAEAKAKLSEYEKEKKEAQRKADEEAGNYKKIAEEAAAELKAKDQRIIRAEVKTAAVKEGIVDPAILDELSLGDVSISDDGEVIGVDRWISNLKTSKPYLFPKPKIGRAHV